MLRGARREQDRIHLRDTTEKGGSISVYKPVDLATIRDASSEIFRRTNTKISGEELAAFCQKLTITDQKLRNDIVPLVITYDASLKTIGEFLKAGYDAKEIDQFLVALASHDQVDTEIVDRATQSLRSALRRGDDLINPHMHDLEDSPKSLMELHERFGSNHEVNGEELSEMIERILELSDEGLTIGRAIDDFLMKVDEVSQKTDIRISFRTACDVIEGKISEVAISSKSQVTDSEGEL